ncbi:MAG: hypothetical protein Q9170_008008 [Blastenia crenularia]
MSRCLHYSARHDGGGNSWFSKLNLRGSDWQSKYVRADVAFEIITVLALVGITIWAFTVQKRSSTARSLFRWFLAAIAFAIINFIWTIINAILNEECASVEQLYIIFELIFVSLRLVSDILLLAAVSTLLVSCMSTIRVARPRSTTQASAIHLGLCGALGLLWLIVLSLDLAYWVRRKEEDDYKTTADIYNANLKVNFVYELLYMIVVVQILIWGVVLLVSSKARLAAKRTPTILLLIITISLSIRQIWLLVIDGVYYLDAGSRYYRYESEQVAFAQQMFYYFCTVIAYATLVAAMSHLQSESAVVDHDDNEKDDIFHRPADTIPHLVVPEPSSKRESFRDHSQDPIWVEPQGVRDV